MPRDLPTSDWWKASTTTRRVTCTSGGSLNTLCDVARSAEVGGGECGESGSVPARQNCRPVSAGILLDNVRDIDGLCRLQTVMEALYGVPVLGWLGRIEHLRSLVTNLPPTQQSHGGTLPGAG